MSKWIIKNAAAPILGILALGLFAGTYAVSPVRAQSNGPYNDAQYPPPNSQAPPPYANGQDPNAPPYNGPYGGAQNGPYNNAPNGGAANGPSQPAPTDTDAGAARISFIHGDVSMQRGDSGETSAASMNTPLMTGDKISTGDASRTEVQLDFANVLRLDSNAQANITTLSRSVIQIELAGGLANFSQYKGSEANVEIDTPNVAVHPSRDGRYRILVTPDGETDVIVRDGEVDISTPQGNTKARKGDLITVVGNSNDAQYKITKALPEDDWDNWNKSRDDLILHSGGRERTNPYYTGTQDLDQYGVWSEVPDYGNVWIPTVQAGWAPYRAGRWVYEPYWGWTWVSVEPWGWAPYHYGRWFLYGDSWAWWPGPVYGGYRPIWAPAYVSFFGYGRAGVGFGFGFGSIGWLAIGPGDYFHPWWGGYRDRVGVVAVGAGFRDGIAPLRPGSAFSNLRDVAVNERLRAGVSGVGTGDFGRGGVARGVSASEFSSARMMTANVPVTPTRDSMRASNRAAAPGAFSGRAASQRFFSTRSAGSQGAFSQSGRQSFGGAQASPDRGAQAGWQRFSPQPNGASTARGNNSSEGGYRSTEAARSAQPGYRPPLDMSKPIVNSQRGTNSPSYAPSTEGRAQVSRPSQPTYRPSYGASSPTYRGGGAPSGGGSSRGSSSRGGSSRSSGGGSHSHR